MLKNDRGADAHRALDEMVKQARARGAEGVAVVAWLADEDGIEWESRMRIVDSMIKDVPEGTGFNLVAVAWSKAAEMMITHQDSGSSTREFLRAEVGFRGGAIREVGDGLVLAAFSGGTSEEDYEISQLGIEAFG